MLAPMPGSTTSNGTGGAAAKAPPRNFGASLGLAVLGAILVRENETNVTAALVHDVQLAFAHSTLTLVHIIAGVLAATFVVAAPWMARGRVETATAEEPAGAGDFVLLAGEPT